MNKIKKTIISILGASDVIITVLTPIILVVIYLAIFGIQKHWTSYMFIIIACLSSLFRAIKIGWVNNGRNK